MIENVLKGVILGLSLAAPPGPVNAMIAFKSTQRALKGMLVGFGALTADLIFMTLVLTIEPLVSRGALKIVGVIGSSLMIYLSYRILRQRDSVNQSASPRYRGDRYYKEYGLGLVMGLTNPFQISWWLTAGLALLASFGPAIVVGFIIGIVTWVASFSFLVSLGRANRRIIRLIRIVSGATLLAFGIYMITRVILWT